MKRLLIISPYFPPSNTADLHRIRMSLPYFTAFGWQPEIITVHERYAEANKDELLMESVPQDIALHRIKALSKKWTAKVGLGSLALRSLWYFLQKGNSLLKQKHFDLVYFSTTQFPVCILGRYWKKRFGIPYVIDMQDPWHTTYYQDKPRHQRPKKYWFSYRLNKYLEPVAMKAVDGLISVSKTYLDELCTRYAELSAIPKQVITFGFSELDLSLSSSIPIESLSKNVLTLNYIGVLGPMMHKSLDIFFSSVAEVAGFEQHFFVQLKGTSYASNGGKTALPIAAHYGLRNIAEDPERMGLLAVLAHLKKADGLLIFGTDDKGYTASKLYPYLQSQKPLLAILHPQSNAYETLKDLSSAITITLDEEKAVIMNKISSFLSQVKHRQKLIIDQEKFNLFSAKNLTKAQCALFDQVLQHSRIL